MTKETNNPLERGLAGTYIEGLIDGMDALSIVCAKGGVTIPAGVALAMECMREECRERLKAMGHEKTERGDVSEA